MVSDQIVHRTVPQAVWDPAELKLLVPYAFAP